MNITITNLTAGDKKTAAIIEFLSNCQVEFSVQPVLLQTDVSGSLPPDVAKEFVEDIKYALSCYETYGTTDLSLFAQVNDLIEKCKIKGGNGRLTDRALCRFIQMLNQGYAKQ